MLKLTKIAKVEQRETNRFLLYSGFLIFRFLRARNTVTNNKSRAPCNFRYPFVSFTKKTCEHQRKRRHRGKKRCLSIESINDVIIGLNLPNTTEISLKPIVELLNHCIIIIAMHNNNNNYYYHFYHYFQ